MDDRAFGIEPSVCLGWKRLLPSKRVYPRAQGLAMRQVVSISGAMVRARGNLWHRARPLPALTALEAQRTTKTKKPAKRRVFRMFQRFKQPSLKPYMVPAPGIEPGTY